MPKIIGKSVTVVEHDGLKIEELAGNVATNNDTLSIAHVTVSRPTSEPWLTLNYNEWICVTKGMIELHTSNDNVTTVHAGETVFVEKGTRFKPVFPQGDTEYIPVCLPAFSPDRCLREEENGTSDVSTKLQELHKKAQAHQSDVEEVLYHMCQKKLWDEAVSDQAAYFPPTFETDGMFTHATAVPQRLITTANHFYTSTQGDWICLQLSKSALKQIGIMTVFEHAKPVGMTETSQEWDWVCPHIYGGIPTTIEGIVTRSFAMKRTDDGTFVSIVGLTDCDQVSPL